ncbi:hypothetical protein QOZ80_4AG0300690 [Eleusine coracana subsp. coracana]|nr:hypothetical protein QOZ80_4AG0300690 [Eleusine coracana subsp. coracana]
MDAYHDQRRFPGSGEAPPPPHASHANTQWYPGPPPPYPPHPSHPYPPQHHQWGPPPAVQHQHHPPQQPYAYQPPPQQQPYAYQPPPPAPGNPWPPHHAAGQPPPRSYPPPPPGQAWTNHSWAPNPGYPGHGNEEDWATKAKAWAATKSVTENHQMQQHAISTSRNENHNYGFPDHYQQPAGLPTEVTEPLQPPVPQSSNDHVPFPMTGQQRDTNHSLDRGSFASPAKNFGSFPSTYEQEVSYNYSSASGNGNAMLQYPSSQAQSFPSVAPVQDGFPQAPLRMPVVPSMEQPPFGHERPTVDPSDQPLEFNSRKVPDMAIHTTVASNHDTVVASNHSWMPSATLGLHSRPPVPPQGAHMDPSVHATPHFGAISGANYVPPASFGVGTVTDVFPTDPNTPFNAAEKSKKPPVPNWLREELLKKKSAPLNASTQQLSHFDSMVSDDIDQPLRKPDQSDSRSNDSAKSTEDDEDDEDEIEAARTAAINQEIKRVLTEVLLKVTDDLFNEIATKVLNEDDSAAEFNEPAGAAALKEPGESKTKTSAKVVLPAKPSNITSSDHRDSSGLSSGKGALLGLANYNSDDDDESGDSDDKPVSNLSSETNTGTANPEKYSSPGSTSFGEDVKSVGIKTQRRTNAELKHEHNHDTQNGEIPSDAKTFVQPKDIHKMDEKMHRRLDKISKDLVKEVKVDHTKELESSVGEKYNYGGKYSMYDKKGSIKESKGSDRIAKHESDTKDPQSRVNSKRDDAMGDRKDIPKDTRERNRDTDRRGSKGKDEKEERSRQMAKSSTSLSSRRSRSRSPRGRSRSRKESFSHGRGSLSSDEPSDNKRKLHSHKNSMSPSPPKSRNRRVSRSPHSKHSHRRHSPYSSTDRKRRSRSRTPVKRR